LQRREGLSQACSAPPEDLGWPAGREDPWTHRRASRCEVAPGGAQSLRGLPKAPTVSRRIRTSRQVADAVGCDIERATELLEELEEMGLAERCIGGWRMTERAEKRYGRALRDMDDEEAAA
jgi:hypothetical protein